MIVTQTLASGHLLIYRNNTPFDSRVASHKPDTMPDIVPLEKAVHVQNTAHLI